MSVRNLQESLFHDKKIYALVVSALHIKCVLSVFFQSFLAETRKVPRVLRTGGTWGTAESAKDSQPPAWTRLLCTGNSLAAAGQWGPLGSEGTAWIALAEVWHTTPRPPQYLDIQMLPVSHAGTIRWGVTRSE